MKPMICRSNFLGVLSIGVLLSSAVMQAMAQELPKIYDASVPRERQIALAESAAPAEVSSNAAVYILGLKGDEKVREGTNGFSCFVGRHFVKPTETTVEPTCFDAEGSRTLLLVYLHSEELRSGGKSEADIKADIANGYKEGRFKYPSKPGFLYMMSSENRLGPTSDGGHSHARVVSSGACVARPPAWRHRDHPASGQGARAPRRRPGNANRGRLRHSRRRGLPPSGEPAPRRA